MMADGKKLYEVQYLYNAVIEFLLFVIHLLEVKKCERLFCLEKHVKFFKHELQSFIHIFEGEDLSVKLGNMLCQTTSIFYLSSDVLYNHKSELFKRVILEDYLVSKIVDLILRGISSSKDLTRFINQNNFVQVEEVYIISFLKHHPHFMLDSDHSAKVVNFHSFLGFNSHSYKAVLTYFTSLLKGANFLTNNDVKLHAKFIPACGVRNPVMVFCILASSEIFKLKNNRVFLKNNKIRLFNNFCNLYHWEGEINAIKSSFGVIKSVFCPEGGKKLYFKVIFNKNALKYPFEIRDIRDWINVRDWVAFDAILHSSSDGQYQIWKATKVEILKQVPLKTNLKDINMAAYKELINFQYFSEQFTSDKCIIETSSRKDSPTAAYNQEVVFFVKFIDKPLNTLDNIENQGLFDKQNGILETTFAISKAGSFPLQHSTKEKICANGTSTSIECDYLFKNNIIQSSLQGYKIARAQKHSFAVSSKTKFLTGSIDLISKTEGMGSAVYCDKMFAIFFKRDSIFSLENYKSTNERAIFLVQCVGSTDDMLLASFVYILNAEELTLMQQFVTVKNFVIYYVVPKMKENNQAFNCDFYSDLQLSRSFLNRRTDKISQFAKCVRKEFKLNHHCKCDWRILYRIYSQMTVGLNCKNSMHTFYLMKAFKRLLQTNKLNVNVNQKKFQELRKRTYAFQIPKNLVDSAYDLNQNIKLRKPQIDVCNSENTIIPSTILKEDNKECERDLKVYTPLLSHSSSGEEYFSCESGLSSPSSSLVSLNQDLIPLQDTEQCTDCFSNQSTEPESHNGKTSNKVMENKSCTSNNHQEAFAIMNETLCNGYASHKTSTLKFKSTGAFGLNVPHGDTFSNAADKEISTYPSDISSNTDIANTPSNDTDLVKTAFDDTLTTRRIPNIHPCDISTSTDKEETTFPTTSNNTDIKNISLVDILGDAAATKKENTTPDYILGNVHTKETGNTSPGDFLADINKANCSLANLPITEKEYLGHFLTNGTGNTSPGDFLANINKNKANCSLIANLFITEKAYLGHFLTNGTNGQNCFPKLRQDLRNLKLMTLIKYNRRSTLQVPWNKQTCQNCLRPPIKTLAVVSAMTKRSLLLKVKVGQCEFFLTCRSPRNFKETIKVDSELKIKFIPNSVAWFCHVVSVSS